MSCQMSASSKISLTYEQTLKAWRLEHDKGLTRIKIAIKLHCSESTISRAYNYYGLPPPKRGKYKRRRTK